MPTHRLAWLGLALGGAAVVVAPTLATATAYVAPDDVGLVPGRVASAPVLRATAAADDPVRLVLRAAGVDARVATVGVDAGGRLDVPSDPRVVGWWRDSAPPGGGNTVIDGHVDAAGKGPGALSGSLTCIWVQPFR